MSKGKFYFKIMAIILLSFWVSSFAVSSVFVHNTPEIRSNPVTYIANRLKNKYNSFIAGAFTNKTKSKQAPAVVMDSQDAKNKVDQVAAELANVPLKTVAKGIYAKDNGQKRMTVINTGEVEKVQLTYELNGETITIIIPKAYYDSLGLTDDEIINQSKNAKQ